MWSSTVPLNKALPLAGALLASLTSATPVALSSRVSPSVHPTTLISVSAAYVANVAHNTYTSTAGSNGKATPTPIPSGFSDRIPPITVQSNGDPIYGPSPSPSSTKQEQEPATNVKRSTIPTKTHYIDSNKFKSLRGMEKDKNDKDWKDGDGWAIKAAQPPSGAMPGPDTFLLIGGYVRITHKDREDKDNCGRGIQVMRTITRDYDDSLIYEISAPDGEKITMVPHGESPHTWDNGKEFIYSSLGAIKAGLSQGEIEEIGEDMARNMGPYNYFRNNCDTFVDRLYDRLR